jgi:uroporphyrinogen decarboxylase
MFVPNYLNLQDAAYNKRPARIPLYDHAVGVGTMEKVMGKNFSHNYHDGVSGKKEFLRNFCEFFKFAGYDTVSYECNLGSSMEGSGALGGHKIGAIRSREEFDKYPWDNVVNHYFEVYTQELDLLREVMPAGMKIIGGCGGGVFETVQDMVGYMDLCYISADDEELYAELFVRIGDLMTETWTRLLAKYDDIIGVCRFGDDLGFKTQTLIPEDDIIKHVVPQYKRIIEVVHSHKLPFMFHSCGQIFGVMDTIISEAKIDAKHSNEDAIAPYSKWVELYGDRIGNFGGIDTDHLCSMKEDDIKKFTLETLKYLDKAKPNGGFAIGSGNSIPDYVPVEGFLAMNTTVREYRGDYKK